MTITTLAQVRSGLRAPERYVKTVSNIITTSLWTTWWQANGFPLAGTWDTTLNGVALTAPVTGQLRFTNPGSGSAYLARLEGVLARGGSVLAATAALLVDRLWHNGGMDVTSTSAQNITSPTWPARDENGATSGVGVLLALAISAAVGAGTPTITVSYTNSSGVSGRTATNIVATTASVGIGIIYMLSLQAGDVGVQSVQSLTLNATWTSGTMNLIAYRPITLIEMDFAARASAIDAITGCLPLLQNGSVFDIWNPTSSTGMLQCAIEAHYTEG